jgi:lysophospholipase L1-like esterase
LDKSILYGDDIIAKVIDSGGPKLIGRLGGTEARVLGCYLDSFRAKSIWDPTSTIFSIVTFNKRLNQLKSGAGVYPISKSVVKTFIKEQLWQKFLDSAKEGDYVFIQFGHNDESPEKKDRYTTPQEFKNNLNKFIIEARAKNVIPILLTPVSRRKFDSLGNAQETHFEYANLVKEVAQTQKTLFIDLDQKSKNLFQEFGEDKSKLLFVQLNPNEHPNYPNGKIDNTHFNELGARLIAQIVLSELRNLKTNLNDHIIKSTQ